MEKSNKLELNKTTIMEAVEYWLNETQFKQPVKVTSFKSRENPHLITTVSYERVMPDVKPPKKIHVGEARTG